MTDLEKATNELVNALDLIKGNKLFDKKLIIETALRKYADSEVKKLNIPAVSNSVYDDLYAGGDPPSRQGLHRFGHDSNES